MKHLYVCPPVSNTCIRFMLLCILIITAVGAFPVKAQVLSGSEELAAAGIDLDVTYISRTPRYNWDAAKQWPAVGETVTFTAEVINKGTQGSGNFSFRWLLDGQVIGSGTSTSIAAQAQKTFSSTWAWQSGRHSITFQVDPQGQVTETAENNNQITDLIDALSVGFWVEQSVYNDFNSKQNGIGTYSWEDWAQYQISTYNDLLARSQLPLAPHGVLTRLRLDKIIIVPDGTLFNLNVQHAPFETATDVQWGFSVEEYLNCPWDGCYDISWNVHHELGHYLFGRVDLYGQDVQGGDVDVRDNNGNLIAGTSLLPYIQWDVVHYNNRTDIDLMSNHYSNPLFLSDHTVYSLNRDWPRGQRTHQGWTYINEIPAESRLKILNNNNQPIPNIQVSVYQAVGGDGSSGPYSQYFDNFPDISGTTNAQGIVSLGSAPFGDINDWSITAGVILVKLHDPASGKTRYIWVEVTDFNLAYWRGQTTSYTHVIHFPDGQKRLRLSQTQLAFTAMQGSDPAPQKIDVSIIGEGADKRWSVPESTVPWLRTIPYANDPGDGFYAGPLSFVIDSADLPAGTYTTQLTVTADSGVLDAPQTIDVTLTVTAPTKSAYRAAGAQDGWVLESSETSNQGGTLNAAANQLYVGDNATDRQFKSILSFNTSTLPDNAVIIRVQLRIRSNGFAGTNMFSPVKTHGNLLVDIRKPYFGTTASLLVTDFQAAASKMQIGALASAPTPGWYTIKLNTLSFPFINLKGITQLRLRFQKGDNDDLQTDYLKIFSGNATTVANRPALIVEYYVP